MTDQSPRPEPTMASRTAAEMVERIAAFGVAAPGRFIKDPPMTTTPSQRSLDLVERLRFVLNPARITVSREEASAEAALCLDAEFAKAERDAYGVGLQEGATTEYEAAKADRARGEELARAVDDLLKRTPGSLTVNESWLHSTLDTYRRTRGQP